MNYTKALTSTPKNLKIKSEIPHLALTIKYNNSQPLYLYPFLLLFTLGHGATLDPAKLDPVKFIEELFNLV